LFFVKTIFLIMLCCLSAVLFSAAAQTPAMPAGFDIGQNSVRGGELGKTTMLQITPYNAGKKLYEDDALTLYERINYLSTNLKAYGDPVCFVTKPGEEHEYYSSHVVAVLNIDRSTSITRELLWQKVRPAIEQAVIGSACRQAKGVMAHVYVRGFDVAADGQVYVPEGVPLPRVELRPLTEKDISRGNNFRNGEAFDIIHGVVSEGILTAHFAFENGPNHGCSTDWNQENCLFEVFTPIYWGAPDRMQAWSLNSQYARWLDRSYKTRRDKVLAEYETRYASLDGFAVGIAYRVKRDESMRLRKALREEYMQAYYEAMRAASDYIEEHGLGPVAIAAFASSGSYSGGVCGVRTNSMMDSCTEDYLFNHYTGAYGR
jgi:hypothetical protein